MATGIKNKTTTENKITVCKRCKAPHFSYQLACKRCGEYFNADDAPHGSSNAPMIMMGALAVVAAIFGACAFFHVL